MNQECKICNLKDAKYYFATPDYMILECETCKVPMAVLRKHSSTAPHDVIESMEHNLLKFAVREYGLGKCRVSRKQIHSNDHLHLHVQPI